MAAIVNDGAIPYGSRDLSINSKTYVADNIEVTRPTKVIERTNSTDEPSGQVIYANFVTGTATLQLAGNTDKPQLGNTFTETFDSTIGAETFYISETGLPEAKGEDRKVSVQFRKKYNA